MAERCKNIWFQQQTLWFSIQLMILVVSYVSCLLQLHALGSFSQQQPQLAVSSSKKRAFFSESTFYLLIQ